MTLNDIRIIIRQLESLAEGWGESIPAIERDLALEKLRSLYDALRCTETLVVQPQPLEDEVTPFSINLDDVLSVDLDNEPEHEAEPVVVPHFAEQPAVGLPMVGVDYESEIQIVDVVQDIELVDDAVELSSETLAELPSEPITEQPILEPVQPKPAQRVEVAASNLFGLDDTDDLFRHRHKKHVLMSLYGMDEEVPSRPSFEVVEKEVQSAATTVELDIDESDDMEELVIEDIESEDRVVRVSESVSESVSEPEFQSEPEPEDTLESEGSIAGEDTVEEEFIELDGAEDIEELEMVSLAEPEVLASVEPYTERTVLLGDVINPHVQTLGESLAAGRATVSGGDSSAGLRAMLGLNDRFLIIRDLFEGDAEAFDEAINQIDSFDDLDDCMIHIAENYLWNPNSDGAKLLMELIERKLA